MIDAAKTSKREHLVVLAVTFAAVLAGTFLTIEAEFPATWGDAFSYINLTRNLAQGRFVFENYGAPVTPPLYPVLLLPSVTLARLDQSLFWPVLGFTNSLLMSMLVPLSWIWFRRSGLGVMAWLPWGLVLGFSASTMVYTVDVMSEVAYHPLFLAGALLTTTDRPTRLTILVLGGVGGAMVLTKAIGVVAAVGMGALVAARVRKNRSLLVLVVAAGIGVPVAAFLVWNAVGPALSVIPPNLAGGYPSSGGMLSTLLAAASDWALAERIALRLAASLTYIVVGTFGVAATLLLTWRRVRPQELRFLAALVPLVLGLNVLAQTQFFDGRADLRASVFTRYLDAIMPVIWLTCGVALKRWRLIEDRAPPWPRVLAIAAGVAFAVTAFPTSTYPGTYLSWVANLAVFQMLPFGHLAAVALSAAVFALVTKARPMAAYRGALATLAALTIVSYYVVDSKLDGARRRYLSYTTSVAQLEPGSRHRFLVHNGLAEKRPFWANAFRFPTTAIGVYDPEADGVDHTVIFSDRALGLPGAHSEEFRIKDHFGYIVFPDGKPGSPVAVE